MKVGDLVINTKVWDSDFRHPIGIIFSFVPNTLPPNKKINVLTNQGKKYTWNKIQCEVIDEGLQVDKKSY